MNNVWCHPEMFPIRKKMRFFVCLFVLEIITGRAVPRWQRNRSGRPLFPPQIHQKIIACAATPTGQLLNAGRGSQKGKPISSEWGRAKDKDKKRDKRLQNGDHCPGAKPWRRTRFQTMGNPLTGGVRGELRNLRGKHKETKWRKFTTEIEPNGNFQLSSSSYTCIQPTASGGRVRRLGLWGSVLV